MTIPERIVQSLRTGEDSALSLEDMCIVSGLPDRETRLVIEDLRRNGVVICSSNKGYYYPADVGELRSYVHKEQARSNSISENIRAAVKMLNEWETRGEQFASERFFP